VRGAAELIAQLLLALFVQRILHRQCLVKHEATRPREATPIALLFAIGLSFVFVGLQAVHGQMIVFPMATNNDIRPSRHCVFKMHVHLVFVTKYRRRVFDGDAVPRLRAIFGKVCAGFDAHLIEMDGEDDQVHLLVAYPPTLTVSALVNSPKDVSNRLLRKERPDIRDRYWKWVLWSPSYFASSCGGAPISLIRQDIEQQQTPH